MLVEELVAHRWLVARHDRGGQNRFVFWKRFLGDEGARHVQVAARPSGLAAESPEIFDELADFLVRELITEGRHELIEGADRAAHVDDGIPVEVGLRSGQAAVGEIGRLELESLSAIGWPLPWRRGTRRTRADTVARRSTRDGRPPGRRTRRVHRRRSQKGRDTRHPALRDPMVRASVGNFSTGIPNGGNLRTGLVRVCGMLMIPR